MWLQQLAQDLRYAWRTLLRSRAFVATTVLTLAVGLGLLTVVFTVFNAYVLRPFSVRDPYSLHEIAWRSQDGFGRTFSWRDYEELRGRRDLFEAVVAESTRAVSSNGRRLDAAFVSGDYFDALGPRMLMGRALSGVDARTPGDAPVAVLSHVLWTRQFDADPGVLGRSLDINGQPFVVVGVLRPEFAGLDDSPRDVWMPLTMYPPVVKEDLFGPAQPRQVQVTVRLRKGITAEQTQGALAAFISRVVQPTGAARPEVRLQATPNPFSLELLAVLSPVFAAFALVLFAACANVSNMMLARATTRHREIAVRLSVGASRGRVVRQLLTEGLLLAVAGGVAGLVVAAIAVRVGMAMFFAMLPGSVASLVRVVPLDFDPRVFLFAFVIAGLTTLMFALLPALHATRLTLTEALRGQPGAFRNSTLRSVLVAGQVSVSIVLVTVAATVVRNGVSLTDTDLGYRTAGVASVNQRIDGAPLVGQAVERLRNDPLIDEIAVTSQNPLFVRTRTVAVTPAQAPAAMGARYTFVSAEYFSILGIPIIGGRGFLPEENRSEAKVAIISRATAAAFWPRADPIGRTFRIERPDRELTDDLPGYSNVVVVGVAEDVVSGFVVDGKDPVHIYLPTSAAGAHASAFLVRGRSRQDLRADVLLTLLQTVHTDPLAFEVVPLDEIFAVQMFPIRAASWIGSLLGMVALLLSVSGLYGVLTYTWSQRTKEIGIRMALGATAAALVRLVMTHAARLAGIGAVIGLVVTFSVMKVLSSVMRMQNLTLLDAGAFAAGIAVVGVATALAAFSPARRATRVNPSEALRADA